MTDTQKSTIRLAYESGKSARQCAELVGCKLHQVYHYLHTRRGVTVRPAGAMKGSRWCTPPKEWHVRASEMVRAGISGNAIAKEFSVSRQAVHAAVKRYREKHEKA